jgi:two-component system, cell cycle sensor histidine kinase PleC
MGARSSMTLPKLSRAQKAGMALITLTLAGVALVVVLIISAARGQDRIAAEKSIDLVRAALAMRERNTSVAVKDYAWWTEAVRNLVDTPDAAWAYEHIGHTTYQSIGVPLVSVIDAGGRQTFTFVRGEPSDLAIPLDSTAGLTPLLTQARAAPPTEPVSATGFVRIGNQIVSVALAALTVADPADLPPEPKPRSILLFGRPMDAETIAGIATDLHIEGLALASSDAVEGRTSFPLKTVDGVVVGALAWTPERPGFVMVRQMVIPVGASIIALVLLSVITLWHIGQVDRARRENLHNLEIIEAKNRELIVARDEAEYANRAKSQFLAVMSHELRTPLNAIIGFSEMIHSELYGSLGDQRYKAYAQDIHNSGDHLLSIINDILDLSKIEAGQSELNEDEVDLAQMIASIRRIMHERAAAAGISFICDAGEGLPCVRADRRALKQILLNLLSNAVKFTPKGGQVQLRMTIDGDRALRIAVSDTGIGIEAEDIPRAMAAFGQVDGSWSRKYEGAGLGLPISRALTQLHGGTLELTSRPGTGTTVTVRLPPERVGPLAPAADRPKAAVASVDLAAKDADPQPLVRVGTA